MGPAVVPASPAEYSAGGERAVAAPGSPAQPRENRFLHPGCLFCDRSQVFIYRARCFAAVFQGVLI